MAGKIHKMLADACVETLTAVFTGGMVADRAVSRILAAHPKWGSRDRSFVASTVYETVRWRRRLEALSESAESDWWSLCGWLWQSQGFARPDWATWPDFPDDLRNAREASLSNLPHAVRASLSDEFDALATAELGADRWEKELTALNQPAPVFLRVNPLRAKLPAVAQELLELGIETVIVPGAPDALQVTNGRAVPAKLRESGRFEIQDAGSQQIAPFLQPEPGQTIIDTCAGAGGKTLHLAALTSGQGRLHATDVAEAKLTTLRTRAARAGVKVQTSLISPQLLTKLAGSADRVLIDAPCSGTGTLRRQADLKYRITAATLTEIRRIQRQVLAQYSQLVRPGGLLVYATCSILPSENQEQATWFSQNFPDFEFQTDRAISPAETDWDGFYMARWARK